MQIYTPNITMKHEEGEPLPSSNDLSLRNRDDCLMLPHRFTNTKKCIMLHLHKKRFIFIWKQKNILALTWQMSAILVAFIFLNLSKFCGTGGQREGIALYFVLITASDGLWITKLLNHCKWMQLQNLHLVSDNEESRCYHWQSEHTLLQLHGCWHFSG